MSEVGAGPTTAWDRADPKDTALVICVAEALAEHGYGGVSNLMPAARDVIAAVRRFAAEVQP